jgi:NAD(P)-dependent dehydrogenase (short-subunit alcohol dehydrogenase family)
VRYQPGAEKAPGGMAYTWAKRTLVSLVHDLALTLAAHRIRVNGVHPTNCNTDMLQHDAMYQAFRPDLEHPTKEDAIPAFPAMNAIPIPWVEPADISNAIVYLSSDEARWVTGQFISVDAGGHLKL